MDDVEYDVYHSMVYFLLYLNCENLSEVVELFGVIIQGDHDVFVASLGDDLVGDLVPHAYRCCIYAHCMKLI